MFAFPSKLLPLGFILAAPVLAACTAATGSPDGSGDTAAQSDRFVPAGVDTTVELKASPDSRCGMSTEGTDGHVDQGTVESDADGNVQVSVLAQGEEPFTVKLDCETPEHVKASYSYEVKGVNNAMQLEKLKAR